MLALAAALALAACVPASGDTAVGSGGGPGATATSTTGDGQASKLPESHKPTKPTKPRKPASPSRLEAGDHGPAVLALQRRLAELGYEVRDPDGQFGPETGHAVVAFQKVNRLDRDGIVGPRTKRALDHPRRPVARSKARGFHVEADLALQVVYLVEDGRVQAIRDASSASGQQYVSEGEVRVAHTPEGSFRVERKINGWRRSPLGLLYRPAYFIGGYALHGSYSVPAFPASHGCIRVTTVTMDEVYDRLALGTSVLVYRT